MSQEINAVMNEYLPLRDVVFQTLRQAILRGELEPGERLMEIHLANRLGVSRTPIREAIRKLELEGLVVMIPRRGAIVASITEKDLKDVLEVRQALDALAIAEKVGELRSVNVVMLGALAAHLGVPFEKIDAALKAAVKPKLYDINRRALECGYNAREDI